MIMRRVKSSKNFSTELKLISILKEHKICGWRRNYKIYGNPDFVFPKAKIALFADGCFWHGHNCRNVTPKDNSAYWANKISANKSRDKEVSKYFVKRGWKVIRIWECDLRSKNIKKLLKKLRLLKRFLEL